MTRKPTPDLLATVRAQTPDDAGLAAMFGPPADGERIVQIAIDALEENPYQRRTAGIADDDAGLINLSTDIAHQGVIQPLVVRPHPAASGRYQIVAGHRRRLAARLAGLVAVPCVVRTLSNSAMLDTLFGENYHREDISPIDRARLMEILAAEGLTHQEIADRFSVSRPTVSNALRLLQLPVDIQNDVASGRITSRQAEALLPLATLPPSAKAQLSDYNSVARQVQRARDGSSSDMLRDYVHSAVMQATNPLVEHWRNYEFDPEAKIIQPRCTGCRFVVKAKDDERCTMPTCWFAKSSAWQAIEHRKIVEATGVPILAEGSNMDHCDYLFGSVREPMGLPDKPTEPPALRCPNLRVRRSSYNNQWDWVCHYGADGSKQCGCRRKAELAASADGKRHWKQLQAQVDMVLTPHLRSFPLDAQRLLARVYGKWDQRESVIGWGPDQCVPVIITGLIKVYAPYEPEKNTGTARIAMEKLLAMAGRRAPWLPPVEQEIAEKLDTARAWLDDFLDPGDGLPTVDGIDAFIEELRALGDVINCQCDDAGSREQMFRRHTELWLEALALQERVQANHTDQERIP